MGLLMPIYGCGSSLSLDLPLPPLTLTHRGTATVQATTDLLQTQASTRFSKVTHVAVAIHKPLLQGFENGLHSERTVEVDQIKVVLARHGSS